MDILQEKTEENKIIQKREKLNKTLNTCWSLTVISCLNSFNSEKYNSFIDWICESNSTKTENQNIQN